MTIGDDLEDLLNKERESILEGQLHDLERLALRKMELFEAVRANSQIPAGQLKKLRSLAARNSSLLVASGRGIRAAITQIKDARNEGNEGFYGPNGKRRAMIKRADQLEQKI